MISISEINEYQRQDLGIAEFYLYGQSWGAVLAMEYYLKYPTRVNAIIFSSPLLNTNDWLSDAAILTKTLPESMQNDIVSCEANGDFSSSIYQEAVLRFSIQNYRRGRSSYHAGQSGGRYQYDQEFSEKCRI